MSTGERASDAQSLAARALAEGLERLRHVDRQIWEDITSALHSGVEDHHNPDLDELDCTLLLDLLLLYRHAEPLLTGRTKQAIHWLPAAGATPPVNVQLLLIPEPGLMVRQWVAGFWSGHMWFTDRGVRISRVVAYAEVNVPERLAGA